MASLALVDSGPLVAAADAAEDQHSRCVEALARTDLLLVIPAMALAEASHFVGSRLGAMAESRFLAAIEPFQVEAPTPADLRRMAELVGKYADFPLGGTDASIVALAERLGAKTIITLDRRHFGSVRPVHADSFELLP